MKSYSNLTIRISILSACLFLVGSLSMSSFAHAQKNRDSASNAQPSRIPVPTFKICGVDVPIYNASSENWVGSRLDEYVLSLCTEFKYLKEDKDVRLTTCSVQNGYVTVIQFLKNPLRTKAHIIVTSDARNYELPATTFTCSDI